MDDALSDRPRKGRGAVSNPTGRFEPHVRHAVDDGWHAGTDDNDDNEPPRLATTVTREACRNAIAKNDSPDVGFDRSINPYRGCEHGCVYCYARPSHAYLGLSPGLDFESRLYVKEGAPEALERELSRPGYRARTIVVGANTDAYQPIEREHRVTRRVLEVLAAHRHPVAIITKSALVLRDVDILVPMAALKLASVAVSLTTLDRRLARLMEPRAATPSKRLATMRGLSQAGVPVTVMAAPMIPALNDAELERILEAAAAAGATSAAYVLLRLPHELKALFTEWLEAHVPDRAQRVLALVRACRGGALYDSGFGQRMKGSGPYAELLARRFALATRRLGLDGARAPEAPLTTTLFTHDPSGRRQLSLF